MAREEGLDDTSWLGKLLQLFGLPVAAWATFCEFGIHWWRISIERLGRAVIAEAELVGLNKLLDRPTLLPKSNGKSDG